MLEFFVEHEFAVYLIAFFGLAAAISPIASLNNRSDTRYGVVCFAFFLLCSCISILLSTYVASEKRVRAEAFVQDSMSAYASLDDIVEYSYRNGNELSIDEETGRSDIHGDNYTQFMMSHADEVRDYIRHFAREQREYAVLVEETLDDWDEY